MSKKTVETCLCMLSKILGVHNIGWTSATLFYEGKPKKGSYILGEANTIFDAVIIDSTLPEIYYLSTLYHELTHLDLSEEMGFFNNLLELLEFLGVSSALSITRRNENRFERIYRQLESQEVGTIQCRTKNGNIKLYKINKIDVIRKECGVDTITCKAKGELDVCKDI